MIRGRSKLKLLSRVQDIPTGKLARVVAFQNSVYRIEYLRWNEGRWEPDGDAALRTRDKLRRKVTH